ncbi:MAG: hypothetical protein NNA20_02980 [Nitrospira sp.]|nr:hypothetical protein [Nitrospira sp.]MCP9441535.1 hypothetical protein [Nitrospira sp.]
MIDENVFLTSLEAAGGRAPLAVASRRIDRHSWLDDPLSHQALILL